MPQAHGKGKQNVILSLEQNWHGKQDGKNADFSAGLRGASLVSNLNGSTFFSQSALLAIQATEARMAEAVEEERERLIGQVSVDIEIALNKAGVLLTEAQGYIAAEAALAAIRSQSNG